MCWVCLGNKSDVVQETVNKARVRFDNVVPFLSLPQDVDRWSFDVFALNSASSDHVLRTLFFELVTRYELNSRFKVDSIADTAQHSVDVISVGENHPFNMLHLYNIHKCRRIGCKTLADKF